ncbi:MAG: hypothetical protein RIR79_1600 [Pseudomonadota bacterium]|jgi:DNA polymerase-3 subunit chi
MKIEFHFGIPDKHHYACRLLRKAARGGMKTWVLCDTESVQWLDVQLWEMAPTDFITHCTESASTTLQRYSSVLLATQMDAAAIQSQGRNLLVNMSESARLPDYFEQFNRVIELVSTDETDRHWARQRWKQYLGSGHICEATRKETQEGN